MADGGKPPSSSGGGKLRLSVRLIVNGAELSKFRLAVNNDMTVGGLEGLIRERAPQIPVQATLLRFEGEDASELFGQDLVEDVWVPGETLRACFAAAEADVRPPLAVTVRRVGSAIPDVTLSVPCSGRTTVTELKGMLERTAGWPAATINLSLQTRMLDDSLIVQELAADGAAPLVLYAFLRTGPVARSGSTGLTTSPSSSAASGTPSIIAAAASGPLDDAPVRIQYRLCHSDAVKTIDAKLSDTLGSIKARIATAEGVQAPPPPPPAPSAVPATHPSADSASTGGKQRAVPPPAGTGGSGERKLIEWTPTGAVIGLARRSHFMYTTPATEAKTLKAWGFDKDPTLFVIILGAKGGHEVATPGGYMETFVATPSWAPSPCFAQTDAGLSCFLSALYVLCHYLRTNTELAGKVMAHLRRLTGCDPVCLALHCLIRKHSVGALEKAAISTAFFRVGRQLAPAEIPDKSVFEYARSIVYYITSVISSQDCEASRVDLENFRSLSLQCGITETRLVDPVMVVKRGRSKPADGGVSMDTDDGEPEASASMDGDDVSPPVGFSRAAANLTLATRRSLNLMDITAEEIPNIELKPYDLLSALLLAYPSASRVEVWEGGFSKEGQQEPGLSVGVDITGSLDWSALQRSVKNLACMPVVRPLSLSRAVAPCLTLDIKAMVCVYLGRSGKGAEVNKSTSIFRPLLSGHPESVDRNAVAQAVSRLLKDGDASLSAGIQDDREADEAVVVLLDTSNSMNSTSFNEEHGDNDDDDTEEEEDDDEDDEQQDMDQDEGPVPAFPDLSSVHCPHELRCPITGTIMLDPVVASDGQEILPRIALCKLADISGYLYPKYQERSRVYEREAITRWIAENTSWVRSSIPSPVGRGSIQRDVELRPRDDIKLRVERWLRDGYILAQTAEATTSVTTDSAAAAPSSSSSTAGAGGSTLTLKIDCEYTATVTLTNVPSSSCGNDVLKLWMREHQLPDILDVSRFLIIHRYTRVRDVDRKKKLEDIGITDGAQLRLSISRPPHIERAQVPVVVHMGERKKEGGMDHKYSLLVRSDVTARKLCTHLWLLGKESVDVKKDSLWRDLTYQGDHRWTGYCMEPTTTLHQWSSYVKMGQGYELEVSGASHLRKKKKGAGGPKPLTRLEVVKQLFEAFINRQEAYDDFCNEFGTEVSEVLSLTPLLEEFRGAMSRVTARGDTSLYDVIEQATTMLKTWKASNKKARVRILCLSDGDDTHSTATHIRVAGDLQQHNIVLDAICIGPKADNKWLRGIAKASGGYCFQPSNLRDTLKLVELETLLSSLMRPPPNDGLPLRRVNGRRDVLLDFARMPNDICNETCVPPARQHPRLSGKVQSLEAALARQRSSEAAASSPSSASGASRVTRSSTASAAPTARDAVPGSMSNVMRRLVAEMRAMRPGGPEAHPAFTIMPSVDDLLFWRLLLTGPQGSLYEGGVFLLYVEFSTAYPLEPPVIRFVTPVLHCNVNPYGRICHSILDRNYTVDTKISTILGCIYGLLLNPDTADPLDSDLASKFYLADGSYEAAIMTHTTTHAKSKSLQEWKREMEADDEEAQGEWSVVERRRSAGGAFTQGRTTVTEEDGRGSGGLRRSTRRGRGGSGGGVKRGR